MGGLAGALVLLGLTARLVIAGAGGCRDSAGSPGARPWPTSTAPARTRASSWSRSALAVMLIVAVALLEQSLRAELVRPRAGRSPAFFFIDIQRDQVAPFTRLVTDSGGTRARS